MQISRPQHSSVASLLHSLQKSGVSESELQITNLQRAQKVGARQTRAKEEQAYRKSNYEAVSTRMDKWVPIIKVNREKQHLDFTQKPNNQARVNFFPSNDDNFLSKRIDHKLNIIGVGSEAQLIKQEEKILDNLEPEEAQERMKAASNRSTVLYQEIKRKRISKIKSKLYRRIKKRQREKEELAKMETLGPQEREEEMEKLRNKRIQERISLRHKTKTKHIQDMMRFQKGNKNAIQNEINDLNRIRREQLEKLNQEMLEDLSEEYDDENFRQQALKDLDDELEMLDEDEENPKLTGLKFMDKAYKANLQDEKQQGQRLRHALVNDQDLDLSELEEEQDSQAEARPKNPKKIREEKPKDDHIVRKKFEKESKSKAALEKLTPKSKSSMKQTLQEYITRQQAGDDNPQETDEGDQLIRGIDIQHLRNRYAPKRIENINMQELVDNNPDLFENFEVMENRREFEQEKANEYEAALPEKPKVVKGWGSWAGPGIQEPKVDPKKQLEEKLKQIEQIKKKRKDGLNQDVIIRETRNKVFAREYLVSQLPYNFKSKEQFDYVHQEPVGLEWNSFSNFTETIKPKIKTKAGEAIQPISMPRKIAKLQ